MADKTNKKEKQPLKRILGNNLYMLRFAAKYTPSYIFWMIVEGVIWGMIHSFTSVIFVKMLFDRLGMGNGNGFGHTAAVIAMMAAFSLATYLFHVWYWSWYNPAIRQKLHLKMQEALFERARSLDLACYDNPTFYNDFVWAINESDGRVVGIMEDIGKLINRLVSTVTITGVLLTIDVTIVVAILLMVVVMSGLRLWRQKIVFRQKQEKMLHERKSSYIKRVFSLPDYSKEIRLSHAADLLTDEFEQSIDRQREIVVRYGKKQLGASTIEYTLHDLLCSAGIKILLVYKLFTGAILLGDFAAGVNAIWKLFWQVNSLMQFLMKFPEHSLYADKFRTFMEYEPKVTGGEKTVPPVEEITFENVSFAYDSAETESLKDVDLTIRKGEKIAIVGYNGAGKSTLIKLLLHLYDPTNGRITLNGTDIREYKMDEYRNKIGAVFQDYQIFAATVAENVVADEYRDEMRETVERALKQSTFGDRLASLKNGIGTQLTREFSDSGVNLSGGEAQKVAIARVFAGDCELVVMDEPSSALDPMAEYELNQTILSYTSDKTVIFISHRLSTTRMADRIYMFDSGRLIEHGSHDELMQADGKYAEMFRMQAEKYNWISI